MDERLLAWGRAARSRARRLGRAGPSLWLFTDAGRMPDLWDVVRRLPRGACGIVFRHDGVANRSHLARQVWQVCRMRRLAMVVAGDPIPLPGVGRHARAGHACGRAAFWTASAHDMTELIRARRAGVGVVFLSPAFATSSHAGAAPHGALRWAALARRASAAGSRMQVHALGGIDGSTVRRLPRSVGGIGAIGAFLGK